MAEGKYTVPYSGALITEILQKAILSGDFSLTSEVQRIILKNVEGT